MVIPSDGFMDGGEAYTEEEMDLMLRDEYDACTQLMTRYEIEMQDLREYMNDLMDHMEGR